MSPWGLAGGIDSPKSMAVECHGGGEGGMG